MEYKWVEWNFFKSMIFYKQKLLTAKASVLEATLLKDKLFNKNYWVYLDKLILGFDLRNM